MYPKLHRSSRCGGYDISDRNVHALICTDEHSPYIQNFIGIKGAGDMTLQIGTFTLDVEI
jgi:hypothetical protein